MTKKEAEMILKPIEKDIEALKEILVYIEEIQRRKNGKKRL